MGAQPNMIRSRPTKLRCCSAAGWSPRRPSLPPRCAPRGTCSGAACLARTRAERLPHVQHTNRQSTLPALGKQSAYKANRDGVAERFADPAVQQSIAVALTLMGDSAPLLRDGELAIVKAAKPHHAHALSLLQTVPGIGKILRRVLLSETHDLQRYNPAVAPPPRGKTAARAALLLHLPHP